MWHIKYKDNKHLTFGTWEEAQPVFARDFLLIEQCYQDGKLQTFDKQMEGILQCVDPATVLSSETKEEIIRQVCNKVYPPGNPPCLKCGGSTTLISEYAKDHFSFFCGACKEWRYIP